MDELSQIKQKIDIVFLIGESLTLKKAGRNFKALCPFHNEKTPSFVVSPERQIFHCFGCSVGGDIFSFLMKNENIEFPEALRILAQQAGVTLKKRAVDNKTSQIKEKLLEVNHLASDFYHYILTKHPAGEKARNYLKNRKITSQTIQTFKLGFAPNLKSSLSDFLTKKKGYRAEELQKAGLVRARDNIDLFRDRIIFPLSDHRENIVGFAGRALNQQDQPKYLNTPDTLLYHKGDLLFGLAQTKEAIKKANQALLVEGEFDLLQCFQEGIGNTVAVKGTAITPNQAKLLSRFTEKVALCLDEDPAGGAATVRAVEILENENLALSVVKLPIGRDPDESLKESPVEFKRAIKFAVPVYDFIIDQAQTKYDVGDPQGKKKIASEVVPFLSKIQNEIVKNHYIRKLAGELNVSEEAVMREVERIEKKEITKAVFPVASRLVRDREEVLAEYILAFLLQHKDPNLMLPKLGEIIRANLATLPAYQKVFQSLYEFLNKYPFSIKKFIEFLQPELTVTVDRSFILPLPDFTEERDIELELDHAIRELRLIVIRKKMKELAGEMKLAEVGKKDQELQDLKVAFGKLVTQLQQAVETPTSLN